MDDARAAPPGRGGGPGEATFAVVIVHPGFAQAARTLAANMQGAVSSRALESVFKDAGRYVAAMCALYLHLTGTLTLPRLKAIGAATGYISAGRARSLLQFLRYLGYLDVAIPERRGAPARYLPTESFLTVWRDHLRLALDAAEILDPAVAPVSARLDDPAIFAAFCKHHIEGLLEATYSTDQSVAFIRTFMHRHAGMRIVWSWALTEEDDDFPSRRPIPISIAATARRHGVSRVHVKRLLDEGVRDGLLAYMPDGAVALQEPGCVAIRWFYAAQLHQLLAATAKTLDEIARAISGPDQKCTVPSEATVA